MKKNKKSYWQLTVRSDFSSAHALRNYKGKCENLHGHNYQVEMTVEGTKLSTDVELIVDFSLLKKLLKKAVDLLDHKNINEFPPFDTINPSAENLACFLYKEIEKLFESDLKEIEHIDSIHLYSVSVSEKAQQTATYREI